VNSFAHKEREMFVVKLGSSLSLNPGQKGRRRRRRITLSQLETKESG